MSTPTSTTSITGSRFGKLEIGAIQKLLIKGYRWLAVTLLGLILVSVVCYGILPVTYLLNSSWIAPVILTKSDPRVASLAGQVFTAKQNLDTMNEELGSATQARHLLQTQHDWLAGIIARYEHSLVSEKDADAAFNQQLGKLATEKQASTAHVAEAVAANRKLGESIEQELKAGLITAATAAQLKASIVTSESQLSDSRIAMATMANQMSELSRGVQSLGGGGTSPQALYSLAQVSVLKQEMSETDLKLVQLNADVDAKSKQVGELQSLLESLKASPFYMAAYGVSDMRRFAFVPYDNDDAVQVGKPIYSCALQIVVCSKVGIVKALTKDEIEVTHPIFNTRMRGTLAELDMKDKDAAKKMTLFVGHRPLYVF
ncbi:hypothetical protein F6X40_35355 [Paraburkholderia sp. UCT31]|uniref:hypothetical protein n=1 Tax=Paraburkholderia sp. UCT31 TaxID=2615209 RepID=UPI001654E6B0|nr:hypothetical protein [Paraburkholderia sp. UCT31]MBC8741828.1 hypothetical protein [Paraburkholderia sp. UCT31]